MDKPSSRQKAVSWLLTKSSCREIFFEPCDTLDQADLLKEEELLKQIEKAPASFVKLDSDCARWLTCLTTANIFLVWKREAFLYQYVSYPKQLFGKGEGAGRRCRSKGARRVVSTSKVYFYQKVFADWNCETLLFDEVGEPGSIFWSQSVGEL